MTVGDATAETVRAADKPKRGRRFYTAIALVVAGLIAWGFIPSYASNLPPPGLPLWVHLHGLLMTGWIILFVFQTWLVGRGGVRLHRRLGVAGAWLVVAIVPLGIATDLLCIRRGAVPGFFTPPQMLSADVVDLIVFSSLVGAALFWRTKPEWHKRLMLCATISLLPPALGRLFGANPPLRFLLAAHGTIAVMLLLVTAGAAYDIATRRRCHPGYAVGAAAILAVEFLAPPFATSTVMVDLAAWAAHHSVA